MMMAQHMEVDAVLAALETAPLGSALTADEERLLAEVEKDRRGSLEHHVVVAAIGKMRSEQEGPG